MKKPILILLIITLAAIANAQQSVNPVIALSDTTVIDTPQVKPAFPGGTPKLYTFLAKTLRYPAKARENNTQGKVILKLLVEKDGSISAITVIQSVSPELDQEAVRVMRLSPKFTPGLVDGKPVRSYYNMPIGFTLASD